MMKKALKELKEKEKSQEMTSELAKKQHDKNKLTARERIDILLDKDSFVELDKFVQLRSKNFDLQDKKFDGDGVITGYGRIGGRKVFLASQDFTRMGGSLGEMHADKIVKVLDMAIKAGSPFVSINDSGGARIQEGINSLDGYAKIFKANVVASGVIPQISLIMGPCAGGAVYSPALTDFVFMVKGSNMFITGPNVIKSVTGEEISFEDLGGVGAHSVKSGVSHFTCDNDEDCLEQVKDLISYFPQNNLSSPDIIQNDDSITRKNETLYDMVPSDSTKPYDVKQVIEEVFDKETFLEIHEGYALNAVVGFARLGGQVVGIVANQPSSLAGCLDINTSDKISRFVRFCDCFNIPLINLVDVPGYLPGSEQEHNGVIRHGAKILYAFAQATVPKIVLVLRKAYGGAYIALASRELGYDLQIAWPIAEIAVMGSEQAVNILFRKEIESAEGPEKEKIRAKKTKELDDMFQNPYVSAKEGRTDMVIDPADTREVLIKSLRQFMSKREKRLPKKHGNMPL